MPPNSLVLAGAGGTGSVSALLLNFVYQQLKGSTGLPPSTGIDPFESGYSCQPFVESALAAVQSDSFLTGLDKILTDSTISEHFDVFLAGVFLGLLFGPGIDLAFVLRSWLSRKLEALFPRHPLRRLATLHG